MDRRAVDAAGATGRWESFLIQVVDDPLPGVEQALVIAGSDKRGTIYGLYDLAERIGVSPWHWWADVPVDQHENLYMRPERYTSGEPAVRYRSIFLNDENPALYRWVHDTFGGFNHGFYTKVFELILHLKGNYLWPAIWGNIHRLLELDATRADDCGIYYHFDYVGAPRSYKWVNKTQIARVWEQMHLAHRYGANRIWIANVGDLKPMEFPISFFLGYAWDPDDITAEDLPARGPPYIHLSVGRTAVRRGARQRHRAPAHRVHALQQPPHARERVSTRRVTPPHLTRPATYRSDCLMHPSRLPALEAVLICR